MKLDYGNQNRLSSGKDPFSFETDSDNKDTAPAVVKPKKFFKSRNIPPVAEESRQDAATRRKSVTDSNNTIISIYDFVKTDCGSTYSSKSTIEPLIGRDQPLPTTTQDPIDILSSGSDTKPAPAVAVPVPAPTSTPTAAVPVPAPAPVSTLAPLSVNTNTENNLETAELDNVTNQAENEIPMLLTSSLVSGSQAVDPPSTSAPTSVKPATKKGDIFKSRSTDATNGNKRLALYEWRDFDEESTTAYTPTTGNNTPTTASGSSDIKPTECKEEIDSSDLTRGLSTVSTDRADAVFPDEKDTIKVRCGKTVKKFYTVAKNVRKAHRIQEGGEFQKFNDDVEYILDTLRENNPNATRCLSAIRLSSKCMTPAFRMHVRAKHGTVAKFFKALHDATKDQSLGLCTATVMFVLSQDRVTMDLDRDCLELMLSLLESDASHKDALADCGLSHAEFLKNKEKVRQLCADIQPQGQEEHLNLDNITIGQLAMETLRNLTSNRAGKWFNEVLRELGGLERLVKTIRECHRHINSQNILRSGWKDPLLDKLRKVDRCLRVLENVAMDHKNQMYLLKYEEGVLVTTLANLCHLCGQEILIYPTTDPSDKNSVGVVIRECLLAITGVLVNLTHQFNGQYFGSKAVGAEVDLMDCSMFLLLRVPESIPEEKRYEMIASALLLLQNLVEHCDDNKKRLMELEAPPSSEEMFEVRRNGVDVLIDLFYEQEELARAEGQKLDALIKEKKDSERTEGVSTAAKSRGEFIEESVTKLLHKAGQHKEHTLIAMHVVVVLGYLIMDNMEYELSVRNRLPDKNFATMISVLQKVFKFMTITPWIEPSVWGIPVIGKLIKFLKMSNARVKEENE